MSARIELSPGPGRRRRQARMRARIAFLARIRQSLPSARRDWTQVCSDGIPARAHRVHRPCDEDVEAEIGLIDSILNWHWEGALMAALDFNVNDADAAGADRADARAAGHLRVHRRADQPSGKDSRQEPLRALPGAQRDNTIVRHQARRAAVLLPRLQRQGRPDRIRDGRRGPDLRRGVPAHP